MKGKAWDTEEVHAIETQECTMNQSSSTVKHGIVPELTQVRREFSLSASDLDKSFTDMLIADDESLISEK